MFRIRNLAATAVALTLVLAACSSDDKDSSDSTTPDTNPVAAVETIADGKLTVCTDAPYPPFEFQDETTDEWTGFDMDLMSKIADSLGGLKLSVTIQPFDGIWLAPKAKTCDVVASAMTITPERQANALFTDPYFDADQSLLVSVANKDSLTSIESLDGKTIAVQSGTTGEAYAKDHAPAGATIKSFDEPAAMFLALESGQVDAVLQDLPVNADRAMKNEKVVVAATFSTGEQYGFSVAQDNTALADAINNALTDLRSAGTYDTIYEKYFGTAPA